MEIKELDLPGVLEIKPRLFHDDRGFFFEAYNEATFKRLGLPTEYVQDNQSFSKKGVVRGLHLQTAPHAQGKLVRVLHGHALDVILDIRHGSPTFGKHITIELDAGTNTMIWVPVGFAHGFAALEDTVFYYKVTALYNKDAEQGILWNDPELGIDWQVETPIVSEKDAVLPTFNQLPVLFTF